MRKIKFLLYIILFTSLTFALNFPLTTNVDADVTFKNGSNTQSVTTTGGQEQNVSISWINSQTNVEISARSKSIRYNDSTFNTSLSQYFVNYPAWDAGREYPKGEKVSYNGKSWQSNWHTAVGERPTGNLYEAWSEITAELPISVKINLSAKPLPSDSAFIPVYSEFDIEIDVTGSNNYKGNFSLSAKKLDTLILPLSAVDVSIKENSANKKVAPAKLLSQHGHFLLSLPQNSYKDGEIRIISTNGKIISTDKLSGINQTSVTVSNVAAGVYLLNAKGLNGANFTSKVFHKGGDLRIAASFNEQFEIGGLANSRTIRTAARAENVGYRLSVAAANIGTKTIDVNAAGGINQTVYISFLSENFSTLMNENKYNEFFPNRYGLGYGAYINDPLPANPTKLPSDGDYDFFTYNSLLKAIDSLGQVEIDLEWGLNNDGQPMGGYQKIEWTNKKTGVKRTFKMPADYDNWPKMPMGKVDYADFCNEGNLSTRKQELAAFLGNISHETTGAGASETTKTWGLYWREEVEWQNGSTALGYTTAHAIYPPTPGKSYHGRGPIQVSWNYNYGALSEFLYGDKQILLDNPDALCPKKPEDATLAFMGAVWFWMTPQVPKPSCHQVYAGTWNPTAEDLAKGRNNSKFGMAIFIINGGLECGGVTNSDYRVADRIGFYKKYITALGESSESRCDCDNMK